MRRADLGGKWQFLAFLLLVCQTAFAQPESNKYTLPLVMPASSETVRASGTCSSRPSTRYSS